MTATDPVLQAVTEALLGAKWPGGIPVSRIPSQAVTEALAPAVLPVIEAEVAAEVVATLRAMAEEFESLDEKWSMAGDHARASAYMVGAEHLRREASRRESGLGVKEEGS
jgi:hypothetical protein